MEYKILEQENIYKGFFKLDKAKVKFDTYDNKSLEHTFEYFTGKDAVTALVFEKDTNCLIFVEQFRFALAEKVNPWIIENVAGLIDENEKPYDAIVREVKEEIGYEANNVKELFPYFSSPGASSKRVFMFYVEVESKDKIETGGGLANEGEDVKVVKIELDKVKEMLKNNEINDGKTIMALHWFLLNAQ